MKQTRPLNLWDGPQVKRAETTWGHKFPEYTVHLFDNALDAGTGTDKYLDLGCGFGRFLEFLTNSLYEFDYVGYDSSPQMLERIRERFEGDHIKTFERNVTEPIMDEHLHDRLVVISSAVLIHLTVEDQDKILENIKIAKPLIFGFDINCLNPPQLRGKDHIERVMKPGFRMTWQDGDMFVQKLNNLMSNIYNIKDVDFPLSGGRYKKMFTLRRKS